MFRDKGERWPEDERILVIGGLGDMPARRGLFNRLGGVLCPYAPLDEGQRAEAVAFARAHLAREGSATISSLHRFPGMLRPAVAELLDAFHRAGGRRSNPVLRLNSAHPATLHSHDMTMTCTLTGVGTIARNADGAEYAAPLDHAFLMYAGLMHRASSYRSPDVPKITLMF